MPRTLAMNWSLSSFHGWGVYGLNLALNLAGDPDLTLVSAHEVPPQHLEIDPLSRLALQPMLQRSAELARSLAAMKGKVATSTGPVLLALNGALRAPPGAHEVPLTGKPSLGVVFLETTQQPADAVARAAAHDLILAGSSWNEQMLRSHGLERVRTVLQGVDPALFHPAPRRGVLNDRFLVFSGGKLERRKGQDLALAAFKRFAERRPDALLVTAWHSPWPQAARTLDVSGLVAPVPFRPDGRADVVGWAAASGVRPDQLLDLGVIPNAAMPQILREMDVAVFPNRCEGGTNLVAMECMACGAPTILSRNSGHLDLIEGENCYPLDRQGELSGIEGPRGEVAGWGESDVDEIVAALEAAYADRAAARRRGLAGAATLSRLSWARTAQAVKAAVMGLL